MKFLLYILLVFFSSKLISQDEFIERYDNKITDFSLKIKTVTKDTLTYKSFGKLKKIATKDIYCYRYKGDYWLYPDSFYNKYGRVTNGHLELTYRRPEVILRKFYFGKDVKKIKKLPDYKVVFHLDSNKTKTLKDYRQITFSVIGDSLHGVFICNLYKIMLDTLVIKAEYGYDGKTKYWKIPFNKISYIFFQTDAQKALKITSGIIFGALSMGIHAPGIIPSININNKMDMNSSKNYEFIKREKIDW